MDTREVEYRPVSVKEVLAEMKDTAELLIDLSFSAVLFGSDAVAEEVLALEERMDVLQLQARMSLLMAARSTDDAERLAPVLGVVGAAEKISDAAGDIAKVVLEEMGLPDAIRAALPEAVETVVRTTVSEESRFTDRTLGDINLETETGVRVIAIRRRGEWLLNPDVDTVLEPEDVLILRGTEENVGAVYETVSGMPYEVSAVPEPGIDDLERAVDAIVLMKNMSELAVDLAYGSVLYNSTDLADEVVALEAEVDALQSRFEAWTLRAAGRVEDPVDLRGLVRLANSTEVISDAALEISEGVLRGLGGHPVVAEAISESDEVIVRFAIDEGAALDGTTIGERMIRTETGMRIIAVRHPRGSESPADDEWEIQPGPETALDAGDVLVAKGTRAGAERLEALTVAPE